ncbi:MAG TPA: IctB family putative bicarbonate transporter [Coleofasciculaceae cyanobacterium]
MTNWDAIGQTLTLSGAALAQWRQESWLGRWIGSLSAWRHSSWLLRWGETLLAVLAATVFGLAPFVETALLGVLLFACAAFWVLLTVTDRPPLADGTASPAEQPGLFTPIHLLVLLYGAIATVAVAFSPVKAAAFAGWTKLVLYLLFFCVLARVTRQDRGRAIVTTVYLLAALATSVYGLRQWIFGADALATWVDPESPLSKTTRVYSYLGNPNLLAGYLEASIPLSIAAILAWKGWIQKALGVLLLGLNGACLVLTFSRGGWIGLVVELAVLGVLLLYWWSVRFTPVWRRWAMPALLGGGTTLLVLAVAAVEPLRDRVLSMFAGRGDSSNNFRINVWQSVIQMIHDRPILGIGPGNVAFNQVYPRYQKPKFSALSAYSIVLEVAVETGLIGFTCFVWLLGMVAYQGWRAITVLRQRQTSQGYWLLAALATIAGMLSHGLVDTVWYRPQVSTLFWLMLALVAGFYQPPATDAIAPEADRSTISAIPE